MVKHLFFIGKSFRNIYNICNNKVFKGAFMEKKDYKLFVSLLLWMLLPSIYNVIRMRIISISQVDINILGQMEWFDLIDEILVTTLTIPLFSLLKPDVTSKEKNGLAFIISFSVYTIFAFVISIYVSSISEFMNAEFASEYLKLQTFSLLIGFISTFCIMLLTLNDDFKMVVILTVVKLLILCIFDFVFIDIFSEIGASCSEIISNSLIGIIALIIVCIRKYIGFGKVNLHWMNDYLRIGFFSGLQIFLDNFIYAIMICRMVNAVSESGNYWVANNFIWGWLLIPVMVIAEIIKKNNLVKLEYKNTWKYGLIISILWLVSVPGWKWFITNVMFSDINIILNILYPLVPFYIAYIISCFIDSWFISRGKTIYNTINSFLVNIVYYGIAFILFGKGLFELNIMFVILLFGFGNVFHMMISIFLYIIETKRKKKLEPYIAKL